MLLYIVWSDRSWRSASYSCNVEISQHLQTRRRNQVIVEEAEVLTDRSVRPLLRRDGYPHFRTDDRSLQTDLATSEHATTINPADDDRANNMEQPIHDVLVPKANDDVDMAQPVPDTPANQDIQYEDRQFTEPNL